MKFVFVSYVASMGFNNPEAWLKRINAYTGILEALAITDTVISIEQIDYEGSFLKNGVQYHFTELNAHERLIPAKLHHFIKNQEPNVVVVHGLHFPLQVLQLRFTLGSHVKIIVQHHAEKPFNGIKKQLQRLAGISVNAYLFASKPMGLDWVKRGNLGPGNKIHEVMEVSSVFAPINRAAALSKTNAGGQPVFLWVGRLNANKDPLNVINAFLRYVQVQPQARLYMIYHTEELLEEIRLALNAQPCYKNNISLIGKVPHADLLYWFNSADFILSGSYYEGSSAAVCEAMSCGCIPVATDIDSFRMITDNGNCGILYQAGNEEALLEALKQTGQMDIPKKREHTLAYYHATLSFAAIALRFREVVSGLSK
ncbi:MAG: glycosyltransferase family 4 protein [Bacteroidota bacterium]